MDSANPEFFVTGGTMLPDAPSYVERQADRDLYESLLQGRYCYVLTARQMGKSSLMVRTAAKLRKAGIGAAVVDLAAIGRNLTIDQWYFSILSWVGRGMEYVDDEIEKFWQSQSLLSPVQKFRRALREIILPRFDGQLVVFIDEVDYVQGLPFPMDEFFAAVRECYNLRAEDDEMRRLAFCLVGVATPSDLIRDKRTTPFNIGQRIELHDFTSLEAAPLAWGLRREQRLSDSLLRRVLHWTGGHPYLTQRLCQAIANDSNVHDDGGVDYLCEELFFTRRARELDDNLIFVRDSVLRTEKDRAQLLDIYANVWRSKPVEDDRTNPLVNTLRLSGVTRAEGDWLKVRNHIYRRVFDEDWISSNMPDAELQQRRKAYRRGLIRAGLSGGAILFLVGALAIIAWREADESRRTAFNAQIRVAQQELVNANISRVEEILNSLKPRWWHDDLRGFEWHHLWQASHRELRALEMDKRVVAVAFMPDGNRVAVGEVDRAVDNAKPRYRLKIFDWAAEKELQSFETASGGAFNLVVFSSDVRDSLVGSENNTARLLDLQTGNPTDFPGRHENNLSALALSPDRKKAVTGDMKGGLRFWDLSNGVKLVKVEKQNQGIVWAAFSRDSRHAVTINDYYEVRLWEPATGRQLSLLKIVEDGLTAAVLSPNGDHLLAADKTGDIRVFDLVAKQTVAKLIGHSDKINAMVFSTDGAKLATASDDRTVRIWDVAAGRILATIKGHGSSVRSVAWSADDKRLVTGSDDKRVKVWDVNKAIEGDTIFGDAPMKFYLATALSESGETYALGVSRSGQLQLLKKSGRGEQPASKTLDGPINSPLFAIFSPRDQLVAVGGVGNLITIWDVNGRQISLPSAHRQTEYISAADFSPDGKHLVFRYDSNTLKLCDATTGRETGPPINFKVELLQRTVFSPDGKWIAVACANKSVIAHNLESGSQIVFKGHTERVMTIAFSPDGLKLATGGQDNTVRLWDVRTQRELLSLGQTDYVQRIAFSPDGRRLVTGCRDGTVKIWNPATGKELMTLHKHSGEVRSLTFSPDGKKLVTSGADGVVKSFGADQ